MTQAARPLDRYAMCLAVTLVLVTVQGGGASMALTLSSSAFASGGAIPKQFTCDAANLSPALDWNSAPAGTKALALMVDDPDAPVGTWVHWVVYDLPADATGLAQGMPADETLKNGAKQGVNDFRKVGYGGPCPPAGRPHRYVFKLYALDASTGLQPRATKADVFKAIQGHVLAEAQLIGTYQR